MKYSNLHSAIKHKRLRQYELAHALKISAQTMSMKLSGRMPLTYHEKEVISKLVGYDLDWLFAEFAPPRSAIRKD